MAQRQHGHQQDCVATLTPDFDPKAGLPDDVFLFVSRVTPLVNVDLLIHNEAGQTLLTWRSDGFYQPGWHVPGGIIRFQERAADRIAAVARQELGAAVVSEGSPALITEIIEPAHTIRGHFISLLFRCRLSSPLDDDLRYVSGQPRAGEWAWHQGCPTDLIPVHEIYRGLIEGRDKRSGGS
jgi:ADP-ribose pyrophosphatase YjhB (NUDIX family)